MAAKVSYDEFLKRLLKNNKDYQKGFFKITGNYTNLDKYITVTTKYGDCNVIADNLLRDHKPGITSATDKTEYFKNYVKDLNPELFTKDFKILSQFKAFNEQMYIQNKYGMCLVSPRSLKRNKNFFKSAVNIEEYLYNIIWDKNTWINRGEFLVNKVGENKCEISDEHGSYKVSTGSLIYRNSKGDLSNAEDKTKNCISRFIKLWGDRYDYSKFTYEKKSKKATVICKEHGAFQISPDKHLQKRGCSLCGRSKVSNHQKEKGNGWSPKVWKKAAEKSDYFDGFKIYIIECWSDSEKFYKIGKTYTSVRRRFRGLKQMPYNYKVIGIIGSLDADYISVKEQELIKNNSNTKYTPKKYFNGVSECFSSVNSIL